MEWRACLLLLALLFFGVVCWSPGFSGPYLFDDSVTPLGDPASQSLSAWTKHFTVTLRPVTKLTYAIEAEAGATDHPAARRIVSLLFHFSTTILLFLLIRQFVNGGHGGPPSGGYAALLACIWMLHPVHADGILLLSGRTAALSALLFIGSLLALEKQRTILAAALFFLAVLSRETILAGILPLFVLTWTLPESSRAKRLRLIAPVVVAAVAGLLWCLLIPRYQQLADFSLHGRPFFASMQAQIAAVPVGLRLLLEPSKLSVDYGIVFSKKLFLLGISCYLLAIAGIILSMKRRRTCAIGLALWLAALLPTQSVIPKLDPLTNRPLSLALAGILLAVAGLFSGLEKEVFNHPLTPSFIRRGYRLFAFSGRGNRLFAFTGMIVVIFLAISTVQRSALFRSEIAVWSDAASKSKTNARPHLQYAMLLRAAGKHREAFQELSAARTIDPFSSGIDALWNRYKMEGTQ